MHGLENPDAIVEIYKTRPAGDIRMTNRGGIAAIAWAPRIRHVEDYSKRLNATLYNIHYLLPQRPFLAPIKYPPQCLKTWLVLLRQRPLAVYVFISPVIAALCVFIYCWFANVPFIMDVGAHAIISRKWAWSLPLLRFLSRKARVNIVDQEGFRQLFESWGAKTLLLERPPIGVKNDQIPLPEKQHFRITLISTFSYDEPIEPVLDAAEQLKEIEFYILGDTKKARRNILDKAPSNVMFTGYLKGDDYWELLASSQAVMALTTASNSLLSGAVEGMVSGKPLILSSQPALKEYFEKGVVFVEHTVDSIVEGIQIVKAHQCDFKEQIVELSLEKRERWDNEFQKIWTLLDDND